MSDSQKHLEAVKSIQKKLLGKPLSYKEIYNLMDEISHQRLSDILTTYFVASSFVEGFSPEELYYLTKAIVETGTKLQFDGIVADKHSTGGVAGTRATMIVVPIVAAAGFKIPKTSSRAITSPAGTADAMEVLTKVTLAPHEIENIVNTIGGCVAWGGRLGIAPADDVIIRVEEPLAFESFDKVIVSIMAKKVAVGANHVVFDIPVGPTMKVRHAKDAKIIGEKFIELGKRFKINVAVDINETHEPAGNGIGPFLEARDVLKVLEQKPDKPLGLEKRALRLAAKLLDLCFVTAKVEKNGAEEAQRLLSDGSALRKFLEIVKAQGGNDQISSDTMKSNAYIHEIRATTSGRIKHINNYNVNSIAKVLGAPLDQQAGLYLHKKIGDSVLTNEALFSAYSSDRYRLKEANLTIQHFPIYEIDN